MDVYGKINIKQTRFKDLKYGDVFCFVEDLTKSQTESKIYMRGGHTSADKTAMNLETGIMYSFDEYEPVKLLVATLNVKSAGE